MTTVIDIQPGEDVRDSVHRVLEALADGQVVGLSTETLYVAFANADQPQAVTRIAACDAGQPVLALRSHGSVLDFVPDIGLLGRRLARRCWPGPVVLEFQADLSAPALKALPPDTRTAIANGRSIRFRVPADPKCQAIASLSPVPLVISTEHDASTGQSREKTLAEFESLADLLLFDGPCRYGQRATVVSVTDDEWRITEPGVVSETAVRRLAGNVIVFVCTGNTCRSPMAEGMFRQLLAEKLQCSEDGLPDRGYLVTSAGIAATLGAPASPESVAILKEKGIDIAGHASQPLTDELLEQADHIYTMTSGHRGAILMERSDIPERVELLARDGSDISDPIGAGMAEYAQCAQEIERHVRALVDELDTEMRDEERQ